MAERDEKGYIHYSPEELARIPSFEARDRGSAGALGTPGLAGATLGAFAGGSLGAGPGAALGALAGGAALGGQAGAAGGDRAGADRAGQRT